MSMAEMQRKEDRRTKLSGAVQSMQSLKSQSTTPTPERSVRHVIASFSSSFPSDTDRIDLLAVGVSADGLSRRGEGREQHHHQHQHRHQHQLCQQPPPPPTYHMV